MAEANSEGTLIGDTLDVIRVVKWIPLLLVPLGLGPRHPLRIGLALVVAVAAGTAILRRHRDRTALTNRAGNRRFY